MKYQGHDLRVEENSFGEYHPVIDGETVLTFAVSEEAALMEGRLIIEEMALQD
jgi:hypothetical protein